VSGDSPAAKPVAGGSAAGAATDRLIASEDWEDSDTSWHITHVKIM
jgi:hypothetical protein